MNGYLKALGGLIALLVLTWLSLLSVEIVRAGQATPTRHADVAIVLGAAVYGMRPSPVFEERIKHGIELYRTKQVEKLLFTGGFGSGAQAAEAQVRRQYAIRHGVPADAIFAEIHSHTTRENLIYARRLMTTNELNDALIVSDPLHLNRALRMAQDLQMEAHGAPTPTTRYRSWRSKAGLLLRELYFYNHYLMIGD